MAPTTMNALTEPERERLIKLLGLLGSDFAGERDAAGLAAVRLLRERGLEWGDVIAIPTSPPALPAEGWRSDIETAIRHLTQLTEWERGFIISLRGFSWPTPRQAAVLRDIARKVRTAEGQVA